jgi:hypothetical protein
MRPLLTGVLPKISLRGLCDEINGVTQEFLRNPISAGFIA